MTLRSLMMSQANFFLQFKSVLDKSAELKIVTQPKMNFRLTWAPKVGLGPPNWGVWGAAATSLNVQFYNFLRPTKILFATHRWVATHSLRATALVVNRAVR